MESARARRRLSAVLAADIVGYSRLVGADEEGTVRRWQAHQANVVGPRIAEYGGRVVKTLGDGLLVEFASAVDAVRSALAIQSALTDAEAAVVAERRMQLRIGINLGDIIVDGADIQGDGVNIAARLQAEAAPGGILVSRGVRDAVAGKAEVSFTDRGEVRLKNIARPMRVFALEVAGAAVPGRGAARGRVVAQRRWLAGGAVIAVLLGLGGWALLTQVGERRSETSRQAATPVQPSQPAPPPIGNRASIAVLPFTNLSGDAQQEYFSDGISEDIITALAKFSRLLVIARNTTFRYKGKAVDVAQVGRELNVRYILEGSVRRDKERVRVTAQLIDARSGAHIWADRFDRKAEDIFAVQDEITERIVGMLISQVSRAEIERARRKPPGSLAAYDHYLRAAHLLRSHFVVWERGRMILEARSQLELAISKDTDFALAYALLASNYVAAWIEPPNYAPLEAEYRNDQTLAKALSFARRAVEIDSNLAEGHAALGWVLSRMRSHAEAFAAYDRAFAINPNLQDTQYGNALINGGRPRDGVAYLERMIRVDPSQGRLHGFIGLGLYFLRDYQKAADALQTCKQLAGQWRPCFLWRAAALAQLGKIEEAKAEVAEVLRFQPSFTISENTTMSAYADPSQAKHLADGLRKAGLPE